VGGSATARKSSHATTKINVHYFVIYILRLLPQRGPPYRFTSLEPYFLVLDPLDRDLDGLRDAEADRSLRLFRAFGTFFRELSDLDLRNDLEGDGDDRDLDDDEDRLL